MRTTHCQGCGTELPPPVSKYDHRKKWCSERCRKRQYDLACVDCGGRVDGTTPSRTSATPRCGKCGSKAGGRMGAQRQRAKVQERRERIAALWHEGATMREIAADVGTTVGSLARTIFVMRHAGWDLPHRYRMVDGRRVANR